MTFLSPVPVPRRRASSDPRSADSAPSAGLRLPALTGDAGSPGWSLRAREVGPSHSAYRPQGQTRGVGKDRGGAQCREAIRSPGNGTCFAGWRAHGGRRSRNWWPPSRRIVPGIPGPCGAIWRRWRGPAFRFSASEWRGRSAGNSWRDSATFPRLDFPRPSSWRSPQPKPPQADGRNADPRRPRFRAGQGRLGAPPPGSGYVRQLQDLFAVGLWSDIRATGAPADRRRLTEAIGRARTVRMRYYSGLPQHHDATRGGSATVLWYAAGALYLVAYCHRRREVRLFAVDRIRPRC